MSYSYVLLFQSSPSYGFAFYLIIILVIFFFFCDNSLDREIDYEEVLERWLSKFMDCALDLILLHYLYAICVYINLTNA